MLLQTGKLLAPGQQREPSKHAAGDAEDGPVPARPHCLHRSISSFFLSALQIQEIKEAVELPLTHPELYEDIGIKPPKVI